MEIPEAKPSAHTARLDGDEWVINGHKLWPTNTGGVAKLSLFPVRQNWDPHDPNTSP